MKAVVLCDGKFGAGPVQAAIDYLTVEKRYCVVGAAIIARGVPAGFALEVPTVAAATAAAAVRRAAVAFAPEAVVDVTESAWDERVEWINEALQLGLEVHGADFQVRPPAFRGAEGIPTITFAGAGPAVGKTAAIIYLMAELKKKYRPAALVLDLGGPPYPEVVEALAGASAASRLLSYHKDGRRVDGDHYSIAVAAGVPAVGCSFAGTGLTGVPLNSLVGDGAILAGDAGGDFLVVEGSGQALPPVAAGALCFLVKVDGGTAALGTLPYAYQLRHANMVVATGFGAAPPGRAFERLRADVRAVNPRVPVHYAPLAPAAVGGATATKVLVITARPPAARAQLGAFWRKQLSADVRAVIGAEEFPPPAGLTKEVRRDSGAGLVVDLAAPNLGDWLAWADDWDLLVALGYEVMRPAEAIFRPLVARAVRAARTPGEASS